MAYVRGDRFSEDFMIRRCRSLHRFIRRISLHPELRRAAIVLQFLESPEWHSVMRSRGGPTGRGSDSTSGVTGPGSSPGGSGAAAAAAAGTAGVLETITDSFLNAFSKVHKPDKRFIEVRERADKLDEDLASVEKAVARLSRREADLASDFDESSAQFSKLQNLEPGVAGPLTSFGRAVHGTSLDFTALRNHTDRDFLTSLRDTSAYVGALRSLLKAREQKQLDFEGLTDYLARAAHDRDTLASGSGSHAGISGPGGVSGMLRSKIEDVRGVDHEAARRDRVRRLEMDIDRLTREVESAKVTSEMFDDRTVRECQEFERIRAVETKETLGALADSHITFFEETAENWERFIKDMEAQERERVAAKA
jgi:sorting nexin-4